MKKENKQLARQKKAEESKKKARKKRLLTVCKYGIPALIITAIIVYCIAVNVSTDNSKENNSTQAVTENTEKQTELIKNEGSEVKNGDTVNIDYVGKVDGVEFQGGNTNGKGTMLTLGSGTYIDGFEEQVVGHKVGETFDISVKFPDNYGKEGTEKAELNGAQAVFTVTINGIYQ